MSSSASGGSGGGGGESAALAAFRVAQASVGLQPGREQRVSAMAAMAGCLFLGHESGHIHVISITSHDDSSSGGGGSGGGADTFEVLVKKKFGKKGPVSQLEVMYIHSSTAASNVGSAASVTGVGATKAPPARAHLLALVENKMLLLDVHTLATIMEIAPQTSFSLFCIDSVTQALALQPGAAATTPAAQLMPRVAAQVKGKKRVILYSVTVTSSVQKADVLREMALPDHALVMASQGDLLALGYKREYSLLHMFSDAVMDVPVPVEGITPLLCRCAPGELLLATLGNMGVLVHFADGQAMQRAPLLWAHTPVALTTCGGYVLALLPEQTVSISSLMDQKQVQSLRLPSASAHPSSSSSTNLLMASYPNAEMVFVCASSNSSIDVSTLYISSLSDQITQYMEAGLANEAAALLARTHPTPAQLADFHVQAGFVCLKACDFSQAFAHYFAQVGSLDPRELIALFSDLTLSAEGNPLAYKGKHVAKTGSIQTIIEAFKSRLADKSGKSAAAAAAATSGPRRETTLTSAQLLRQARFFLAQYLWNWRMQRRKQADERANSKTSASSPISHPSPSSSPPPSSPSSSSSSSGALLASISSSLVDDPEVGQCVDTALLFLAVEFPQPQDNEDGPASSPRAGGHGKMARRKSSVSSLEGKPGGGMIPATSNEQLLLPFTLRQLLFPSNACVLADSEKFLFKQDQFHALALLFQSKGELRRALLVWQKLGKGEYKSRPAVVAPKQAETIELLDDYVPGNSSDAASSSGRRGSQSSSSSSAFAMGNQQTNNASSSPPSSLAPGVAETVSLLSGMSDQPLLWEFAEWVIESYPSEGLKIFLSTSRASGDTLPPELVLTFLKKVQTKVKSHNSAAQHGGLDGDFAVLPSAAHVPGGGAAPAPSSSPIDLVESYLEYHIGHNRSHDTKYHTQLALAYLKKVVHLQLPTQTPTDAQKAAAAKDGSKRSSSFTPASASATQRFKPGHEPGMRGPPRLKLLRFLQRSQDYDAQTVLNSLLALQQPSSAGGRARSGSTASSSAPPSGAKSYSGLDLTQHASNLYEEVLLLLSRLGQHKRVLQMYVFDLRDEAGAAAYASFISNSVREAARRKKEKQLQKQSAEAARAHSGGGDSDEAAIAAKLRAVGGGGQSGSTSGAAAADDDDSKDIDAHPGDVFLQLLDIYFSPEYATLWAEKNPEAAAPKNATRGAKAPAAHDAALALLNKYYHLMDPVPLLKLLPPTLPLHTLQHLFSRLLPSTLHARRHGAVVQGLHKLVHLRVQSHCFALRSLQLNLDETVRCGWCYKSLSDAVFVAHPYHAVRDPLEKAYIIDYEGGGDAPVVRRVGDEEDEGELDRKQLRHEMPRFVLVHYQCSASFAANGGAEALLNSEAPKGNNKNDLTSFASPSFSSGAAGGNNPYGRAASTPRESQSSFPVRASVHSRG